MQQQYQETKTLLIKECGAARKAAEALLIKEREAAAKEAEQVPVIQEVSVIDHEMVIKLTVENEQLKALVSSLEKKVDETERKFKETNKLSEERLKQALDAELKIIELKTNMQRFEEKLSDIETDDQILRHEALLNSSSRKMCLDYLEGYSTRNLHKVGRFSLDFDFSTYYLRLEALLNSWKREFAVTWWHS